MKRRESRRESDDKRQRLEREEEGERERTTTAAVVAKKRQEREARIERKEELDLQVLQHEKREAGTKNGQERAAWRSRRKKREEIRSYFSKYMFTQRGTHTCTRRERERRTIRLFLLFMATLSCCCHSPRFLVKKKAAADSTQREREREQQAWHSRHTRRKKQQ